jgi:5-methylcytosine-specific restriction endonuclease McrBC regulatory subunit McrC
VRITLAEWRSVLIDGRALSAAAGCSVQALADLVTPLVECRWLGGDQVQLMARRRVGEVAVGDLSIEVRPHLPVGDLFHLFAWTSGARLSLLDSALGSASDRETRLIETLAFGLVLEAEQILRGDIHRTWQSRDERLLVLRGRPRFEQLGAAPAALGVPCTYAEVTRDTPLNQLIAAGLSAATRVLSRQHLWLRRARAVAHAFLDLARSSWPTRVDFTTARERITPRTEGYRSALVLTEWLLLGGGPLSTSGGGGASGWWLDMPTLFELSVAQAVARDAQAAGLSVRAQPVHRYAITYRDGQAYQKVRPDLEIFRGETVVAVLDAKYKDYGLGMPGGAPQRRVAAGDLYQLAFYGSIVQSKPALIFVVPADPAGSPLGERWRHLHVANRPVTIVGVDLSTFVKDTTALWRQIAATLPVEPPVTSSHLLPDSAPAGSAPRQAPPPPES